MWEIAYLLFMSFWLAVFTSLFVYYFLDLVLSKFPKFYKNIENSIKKIMPDEDWNLFSIVFIFFLANFVLENLFEYKGLGLTDIYFDAFLNFLLFIFEDLGELILNIIFYLIIIFVSYIFFRKLKK